MKRSVIKLLVFLLVSFAAFRSSAQLKIGDQPTQTRKAVALDVQGSNGLQGLWLPRVSDTSSAGIKALNPPDGLIIYHPPSGKLFIRSNNTWVSYLSQAISTISSAGQTVAGPDVTFQTGSSVGTVNNFNIAANSAANTVTFNMPDASATVRGVVTTGSQTLAGAKTFANGVTVNNGTTANNGLTVSGATGNTSNLTLGITSATPSSGVGSNVLSVDAAGKVILTSTNIEANKPTRVLNYTLTINGSAANMSANSTYTAIAALPAAANVSFPATVFISPSTALANGTTVDWATILNNNLVANISTRSNSQNLDGYVFYVTIIDF
jgi:hypothetical protein